jgi:CSLREA domain-containing protein
LTMKRSQFFWRKFALFAAFAALPTLIGLLFVLFSLPASAQATIAVTTTADELNADGDCSLREAIEAANRDLGIDGCTAGSGYDTIAVPAGSYTLMLAGAGEDANQTGDYDITSDMQILGAGAEIAGTEIAGDSLDRLFHVHPGATVTLARLGLRAGLAAGGEAGGAVLNQGVLAIEASTISASRSGRGQNCVDVPAPCEPHPGDGGGIHNSGTLTMTATSVRGNRTGAGGVDEDPALLRPEVLPDGSGGGVSNAGMLLLAQCEIAANEGWIGAGVYNTGQAAIVETSTFNNRTTYHESTMSSVHGAGNSSGSGGGIANAGGVLELRKSSVYDNYTLNGSPASPGGSFAIGGWAGDGGGIYNSGVMTSTNSTVAGNRTGAGGTGNYGGGGGDGGGVYNRGLLVLNNTTIAANNTDAGGQGLWYNGMDGVGGGVANAGTVRIKNSLLANNWAGTQTGAVASDCAGDSLATQGYNLISAGECSGVNAPSDLLGAAAQLAPLGDYGGPAWTCALLAVSPAVDAGSCTDAESNPVAEDQRGVPRPQLDNCDIGAYEAAQPDPLSYAFLPVCRP